MSVRSEIEKFFEKFIKKVLEKLGKYKEELEPKPETPSAPEKDEQTPVQPDPGKITPVPLPNPSHASCWEGGNAQIRHMNELSPKFSDADVENRVNWAKGLGCDTLHWFVCNQADGEKAGYSIYGGRPSIGKTDKNTVDTMKRRIRMANKKGLAVVLWLMADDSGDWNTILLENIPGYVEDLRKSGLLDMASGIVLGLEMNEYVKDKATAKSLSEAVRKYFKGPVGTHHTSGEGKFAAYGDILFWQVAPKSGASAIKKSVKAAQAFGKPVLAFELERNPNRASCEAAFEAGAIGVGNWDKREEE